MKKVLLLLAQGFEEYEASVFTDILGWSRTDGDEGVQVTTVARRSTIRCTWNMTVTPEKQLEEVNPQDFDALAIPGGYEEAGFYEDAFHEDLLSLIRAFHDQGKIIATICVAALALGKSGILKGRQGTTYHLGEGKRRKQLGQFGVSVLDRHIVRDGNIITSSCPATAVGVAFLFLEMLTTKANVQKVKTAMGFVEGSFLEYREEQFVSGK